MSQNQNLYMPYFYNWTEFTDSLSDEELGILVRALSKNVPDRTPPPELPQHLKCIYQFMMDSICRVVGKGSNKNIKPINNANTNTNTNANTNTEKRGKACASVREAQKKERYGDYDVDEAFRKALERSYGEENGAVIAAASSP